MNLEDKSEALQSIKGNINSSRGSNQIPDPWEGSYTAGKPQSGVKKTKKKRKSKNKNNSNNNPPEPPEDTPENKRSRVVKMVGGKILDTAKNFSKTILKPSGPAGSGGTSHYGATAGGGSTPSAAGEGPSLFGIGAWLGKKIVNAFQDAKVEKVRALEAQSNGAEVPAEMLEPGYFLKKSIGYQFGGRAFDTTFGAFIENMPSKQSSKKAGFGDQFDYGENDPKKKKNKESIPGELASGFRAVNKSLKIINKKLDENIGILSSLVNSTNKVADSLQEIAVAISGLSQIEMQYPEQVIPTDSGGDSGGSEGSGSYGGSSGLNVGDAISTAENVMGVARHMRGTKTGLGNQNKMYRAMRESGMPSMRPPSGAAAGEGGMMKNLAGMASKIKLSGGASVQQTTPVMVGEAGPELVVQSGVQKLAGGGLTQGAGSNVIASLGGGTDLMKRVQPFADVLQMPFKVIGSQISSVLSALVSAAGPFSGVIARMFSPLLGGLATIFGLNEGAFAAELDSASMTERQGANELGKFFRNFFKLFGIDIGGGDKEEENNNNSTFNIQDGPVYEKGAQIAKILENRLGIKDYQAAAIVGNMIQESSLVPDKLQGGAKGTLQEAMSKGIGYSYPQWTDPGRQRKFAEYMESKGHDWKTKGATDDLALGYVIEEFPTYMSSVFTNTKDVASASNWVLTNYEGPADKGPREQNERTTDSASVLAKMARGGSAPIASNFSNQVQGTFQISGPDSGYYVPPEYTGGQQIIGHGVEWLINFKNKFVILPVANRQYNVYKDPEKTYQRYEQIGRESGVEVAGLVDFVDNMIFGSGRKGPSTLKYGNGYTAPKKLRGWAADESGAEILEMLGGTRIKGASLPSGTVTPVNFQSNERVASVAILNNNNIIHQQQVPVFIPVPVPGPTEYIPANPYHAAKTMQFVDLARNLS
jgi:hypothetical protein